MSVSDTPEPSTTSSRARAVFAETARRRLAVERGAGVAIRLGGLFVILSIAGIFAFLVAEVLPVLRPARITPAEQTQVGGAAAQALLLDEYRTHDAALGSDGMLRVLRLADGHVVLEQPLGEALVAVTADPDHASFAGLANDGVVHAIAVDFAASFDGSQRVVRPELGEKRELALFEAPAAGSLGGPLAARMSGDVATAAAPLRTGGIALAQQRSERNAFTGEVAESIERRTLATSETVTALALDAKQENLYAGTASGAVLRFDLRAGDVAAAETAQAGTAPVTSLALLIGGRTLVVGLADGSLSTWFAVPQSDAAPRLTRVRDYPAYPGAVLQVAPSQRDRSFLVSSADGTLGLQHSTSGRTLWRGASPLGATTALSFAPKGDAAAIAAEGRLASLEVASPHPELSLGTLFGKVWYEGASEPEWVWQSSSGDDAFEPKLSLVPLLVGTLKGTFYALLLAVPLGVLGAMYTSQFMHPRLQRWVKPGVELMAALPSVVLGFLAGLWLAPRVERLFPAFVAMGVAVPLAALAGGWLWSRMPRRFVARLPDGTEVLWIGVAIALVMWVCVAFTGSIEAALFGGSFPSWLDRTHRPALRPAQRASWSASRWASP